MVQQKVQLRKIRDFGENLNDTFQFIRQEFKPLVISFLLIAGVFVIAQSIAMGLFQGKMFAFLDEIKSAGFRNNESPFAYIFTAGYFALLIFSFLSIVAMRVVVACYMKLYDDTGASPTVHEVWALFMKYFLKNLFYSIPVFLITIVGCIFCLLPGIYFAIVFTPFQFIVVTENLSFSDAFSRCFTLIKENFWVTLGLYLITYLIYSVGSGIIGLFVGAIVGTASYFTTNDISNTVGIATSVINAVAYVFYIIFFVAVAMHYYNLVERVDGTGMTRRLENLGNTSNHHDNIEEQY